MITPKTMQAVTVTPGTAGSLRLREVARPQLTDVPGGRGVEVAVIRVGGCGTDREIVAAEFGTAPAGDDVLIIGHESLGRIERVGANAPAWATPGTLVVAMVRRPGSSVYDDIGRPDLTTDPDVVERGINRMHGFLAEAYVDDARFLVPVPDVLEPVAVLLEPLSIVEKGFRVGHEVQRRLEVWEPQRVAIFGAGTIGMLAALVGRLSGLDVTVYSRRRPPYLNRRMLEANGAADVSSSSTTIEDLGQATGPFDLVLDATGYSPLSLQTPAILAPNGIAILASVTGGDTRAELPTDRLNQSLVLGNRAMVGTVNAARRDFERGVARMLESEARHPGWLGKLLTTRIHGLEGYRDLLDRLEHDDDAIKVVVEVAGGA
jgi:threonine dehydrogenase-like Zn-dependent dehydrogenase